MNKEICKRCYKDKGKVEYLDGSWISGGFVWCCRYGGLVKDEKEVVPTHCDYQLEHILASQEEIQ